MASQAARLTKRVLREIGPAVDRQMARWRRAAEAIADPFLREQALASQEGKRFHAVGGSVYALLAPGWEQQLVVLVVALQTISDYLDNLCDRTECDDLQAYRALHEAIIHAVQPPRAAQAQRTPDAYYRYYPFQNDNGYLTQLVNTCREVITQLPAFHQVQAPVEALLRLYTDLQVYKHGPAVGRVTRLQGWFRANQHRWPSLVWPEFAAASGSTLGVFALLASAADPRLSQGTVQRLCAAYFPWIGAFHILLDYLIDLEEDFLVGDLNLVAHYADLEQRRTRLLWIARRALEEASTLPRASFHRWIVQGLPALYLSDPKVKRQGLGSLARSILASGGKLSWLLYALCRAQRHPVGRIFLPPL